MYNYKLSYYISYSDFAVIKVGTICEHFGKYVRILVDVLTNNVTYKVILLIKLILSHKYCIILLYEYIYINT